MIKFTKKLLFISLIFTINANLFAAQQEKRPKNLFPMSTFREAEIVTIEELINLLNLHLSTLIVVPAPEEDQRFFIVIQYSPAPNVKSCRKAYTTQLQLEQLFGTEKTEEILKEIKEQTEA